MSAIAATLLYHGILLLIFSLSPSCFVVDAILNACGKILVRLMNAIAATLLYFPPSYIYFIFFWCVLWGSCLISIHFFAMKVFKLLMFSIVDGVVLQPPQTSYTKAFPLLHLEGFMHPPLTPV